MRNEITRSSICRSQISRVFAKGITVTLLAMILSVTALSLDSAFGGSGALLNKERMLMVNGQPRFLLGLYENPKDDAVIKEAVESGFNLIQCSPDIAALDRLHQAGVMAWVNLGGALDLSNDVTNRCQQLTDTVQRVKYHPALLVWEGPDEILWNNWWLPRERIWP